MLFVIRHGSGFKIGFKYEGMSSYQVIARDLVELTEAIQHHYGEGGHGEDPSETCPLCRLAIRRREAGETDAPSEP